MKIFLIKLSGFPQTHKKGLSMLLQKLCRLNFYLHQEQSSLLYETFCISSITPLESEVSTAVKCSVSMPDN